MSDAHATGLDRRWSERSEAHFDAKLCELGVADGLKNIPGVTSFMLVVFGEHGIKSIEDLAGCATDDLDCWTELRNGRRYRRPGILDGFRVSRKDCEMIIINARIKAGWIDEASL
jgi:transcription termination/antitermination protein NusA